MAAAPAATAREMGQGSGAQLAPDTLYNGCQATEAGIITRLITNTLHSPALLGSRGR